MKNYFIKGFYAVLMLGVVYSFAMLTGNQVFALGAMGTVGVMSAMSHAGVFGSSAFNLPLLPDFKEKSQDEIDAMSAQELKEYRHKEIEYLIAKEQAKLQPQLDELNKKIEEGKADKAEVEKEKAALEEKLNKAINELNVMGLRIKQISEAGYKGGSAGKTIKEALKAREEEFKSFLKSDQGTFKMEIDITNKATTQVASDIDSGTDFAQMLPGVGQIPKKRTYIKDRIRVIPTNTEYIKYLDQETVVRDAQNVAACGASDSTTKLTWKTRTLQQEKVRDFIHVCVDMLEDYDFIEAELRNLIESSVALKVDNDLLLADGISPNPASIDFYSATFSAASAGANYVDSTKDATVIDLITIAGAQISAFGEENSWMADTAYMNPRDITLIKLLKDADGNSLRLNSIMNRVTMNAAGNLVIDGQIEVIANPNVTANEMYVFDSTQAAIYQKKTAVIEFSYENRSNFETETVTIKAYERLNLLVRNVNANAFLHIADIDAALADIDIDS